MDFGLTALKSERLWVTVSRTLLPTHIVFFIGDSHPKCSGSRCDAGEYYEAHHIYGVHNCYLAAVSKEYARRCRGIVPQPQIMSLLSGLNAYRSSIGHRIPRISEKRIRGYRWTVHLRDQLAVWPAGPYTRLEVIMAGVIKTLKIVDGGSGTDAWQFSVLCKRNKQLMMRILLGSHNITNLPCHLPSLLMISLSCVLLP
jgi:hypothetical protein